MRSLRALVVLGALCVSGYSADQAAAQPIGVLVFDYSGVPADILEPAMRESKRIMVSAGVELAWTNCPVAPERLALDQSCRDTPGPLSLVLHILPRGASRRQTEPGAFGFAVPPENGGFGAYACVFYDRVESLSPTISKAAALGHVIAHELGHLLLGTGHHSVGGIMKADWRRDHLKLAAQRALRFDEAERGRVLEKMRRRTQAAQATPVQVFAPHWALAPADTRGPVERRRARRSEH